jgi:fumarate hydratase class II
MSTFRTEHDSMGSVSIPEDRLWGAATQRARDNLPIANVPMPLPVVHALAHIKSAAAVVNQDLGVLPAAVSQLIQRACQEIIEGRLDAHFPLDCFQTGSGTSTNMNLNEVISNRAAQLAGLPIGMKTPVHPNDHVNRGQSSNDTFPSALHVAGVITIHQRLLPALEGLTEGLERQAQRLAAVLKIGRTHLQDATPISLGQEFSGYAEQMRRSIARARQAASELAELPLGGTAVGTGINTHPAFATGVCAHLQGVLGHPFREAANHFEAAGSRDTLIGASAKLKQIAVSLSKIVSDLRLLGSGPRCGLGELRLPALQPGSSIMPGKVNPVVCESVMQVCIQVIAHDSAIAMAGMGGVGSLLELNLAMPLMARCLIESVELLATGASVLDRQCVAGIEADLVRCQDNVERSLMMATALAPLIGYDAAAKLASRAAREGRTIRELALQEQVLPPEELARCLDPARMITPGTALGGE